MTIFKMTVVRHLGFSKFEMSLIRPSYYSWIFIFRPVQISRKSDSLLQSYGQIRCFPIWRTSAILNLKITLWLNHFGRPYLRSRLCYSVASVCRLSVCLWRYVLWPNGTIDST